MACVNIMPSIKSVYKWEGKLEVDQESLMIVKTHSNRTGQVVDFVRAHHDYEVPEIIFTAVSGTDRER